MNNLARPAFEYQIELGSESFRLRFRWNTRFAYWTVDLLRADGTAIVTGRKMILNRPIFEGFVAAGLPSVNIVPLDSTGKVIRIERGDLANAVELYAI